MKPVGPMSSPAETANAYNSDGCVTVTTIAETNPTKKIAQFQLVHQ